MNEQQVMETKLLEGYIAGLLAKAKHDGDLLPGIDVDIEDDEHGVHQTLVTINGRRYLAKLEPEETVIGEVI